MTIRGQNNLSIAILGVGGIGGLLACLFWKIGFSVLCIARPNTIKDLNKSGLRLRSQVFGDFIAGPRFVSRLDFKPDILFITTKAGDLLRALDSIPRHLIENSIVVPLLNGFEHIDLLRKQLGRRVVVGMIGKTEAKKDLANNIIHVSSGAPEVEIASDDLSHQALQKVYDMLMAIGINIKILDNENEVIWRKLVRLNAVACVTAATNQPLGFAKKNKEWRKKLEDCAYEGVLVAKKEGVHLDFDETIKLIYSFADNLTTSLQRDIASGLDSELEAIPGAILRCAKKHRIACPTIEGIYKLLKYVR